MADRGKPSSLKRSLGEDDVDYPENTSLERKVRFPKGKKTKRGNEAAAGGEEEEDAGAFGRWMNPELASKERAKRRAQNRENDLFRAQAGGGAVDGMAGAEVHYEVNASFEDDGIRIEPFNLKEEREEGYFDIEGNYVEYVAKTEIKDAWLDNIDADPRLTAKINKDNTNEEEFQDLSSDDIGKIKRRIANTLQPGETVLQALKRLKGTSGNRKEKMPVEIKRAFDGLTEGAMKLMESDVYYEKKETFEREAEGYERLAHARAGDSKSTTSERNEFTSEEDMFSDAPVGETQSNTFQADEISAKATSIDGDDAFDIFGDEDEKTPSNPSAETQSSQPSSEPGSLPSAHQEEAHEGCETDYVFDDSSGYYYSSSLGYYFDPTSGLYCSAASGKWYSFNEQTGSYDEILADGSRRTAERATRDGG